MGQGYATEIVKCFTISNTQTLCTLERLEEADILIGNDVGRTRIYALNPQWILANQLKSLLNEALLYIPLDEQQLYFNKRQHPRKKNKIR